jgi:hypothetical protein
MPDLITEPTLAKLLAALVSQTTPTPQDSESANTIGAYERQTRLAMYQLLSQIMSQTEGKILSAALPSGVVADYSLTNVKIAPSAAISESKVALMYSTAALKALIDACVTLALAGTSGTTVSAGNKLVDNSDTRLTNTRVPTDASVTDAKITASHLSFTSLARGTRVGDILVANSSDQTFTSVPLSGDATISSAGVLTLATKGVVLLAEKQSNGVSMGDTTASTVHRGLSTGGGTTWIKQSDASNLITTFATDGKIYPAAGTYLINASVPCCVAGNHAVSIYHVPASGTPVRYYGVGALGLATVQTRLTVQAYVTFASGDYFYVDHISSAASATGYGLGKAANLGYDEYYTQVQMQLISR